MELRIPFFTNSSDELDRSTEAADIDVSRKSCKTFTTFGNILCMVMDGVIFLRWCQVSLYLESNVFSTW